MKSENIAHIICEVSEVPAKPKIVSENAGQVTIETILQTADTTNRNKRIYTKDGIQSGLESDYIKERLDGKSWYGEAR